jgi:hypothetical protein
MGSISATATQAPQRVRATRIRRSDSRIRVPFGAEGLRAFIGDLIDARVFDGLSECDADTVAMLVVLDFLKGPHQLAWRIYMNG